MATSPIANKLASLADKLEEQLQRQRSKGGDSVTLGASEVKEIVESMRDGFAEINGFVNGGF